MSPRFVRSRFCTRIVAAAVWLLILFIPVAGRAQSGDVMSLVVGTSRTYLGADGPLVVAVTGECLVLDRPTATIVYDRGRGETYTEYLSRSPSGDLLLHGRRIGDGAPEVFEPPLAWYTPGARSGRGAIVRQYARLDGTGGSVEAAYFVAFMGMEKVATPAGEFTSCHVVELTTDGDARWYHPQAGLVQLSYPLGKGVYRLVDTETPVGVEDSTWSGLKAMFR